MKLILKIRKILYTYKCYRTALNANIKILLSPSSWCSEGSRDRVFENMIKYTEQYKYKRYVHVMYYNAVNNNVFYIKCLT